MKLKKILTITKIALVGYSIYFLFNRQENENKSLESISDLKEKLKDYDILDGYLLVEENLITYNFETSNNKNYKVVYNKDNKQIISIEEKNENE